MVCTFRFQEDPTTPNKQTLQFNCDLCSLQDPDKGDISTNYRCRRQFIQLMPFIDAKTQSQFFTKKEIIIIPNVGLTLLKEYSDLLFRYTDTLQILQNNHPKIVDFFYSDPLQAFYHCKRSKSLRKYKKFQKFFNELRKTRLFNAAKPLFDYQDNESQLISYENILEIQRTPLYPDRHVSSGNTIQILDCYDIGPFKIEVGKQNEDTLENHYRVTVIHGSSLSTQISRSLVAHTMALLKEEESLNALDQLLDRKIKKLERYLKKNYYELNDIERKNLAIYSIAQTLNLTKTMPLLLDDDVQEFFLDGLGRAYYLDHAKWGRCYTNLLPVKSEIEHLVTRLRLESHRPLDENTPSLKTELKTKFFHVRAAVDVPPLANEGPYLNIRKIRLRVLTLPELINHGSISLSAAAFLVLCMSLRVNITIGGEPSTGKTTLANAINLLAPPHWRRITIEDALESITLNEVGRHKVTFKVDPFDSLEETSSTKSNEIIRLLHRSPDWVFLGEIQTAEHSLAMFHALSAGIRGIQTCHASSNEELLQRWHIHHQIPQICFRSLGLLVYLTREITSGKITRRVAQISEIHFEEGVGLPYTIYEWDKEIQQLKKNHLGILTPSIRRACQFQQITNEDIKTRYEAYKEALDYLAKHAIYEPGIMVPYFDQVHAHVLSYCERKPNSKKEEGKRDSPRLLQKIR